MDLSESNRVLKNKIPWICQLKMRINCLLNMCIWWRTVFIVDISVWWALRSTASCKGRICKEHSPSHCRVNAMPLERIRGTMDQVVPISLTTLVGLEPCTKHMWCIHAYSQRVWWALGRLWSWTRYLWVKKNSGAECQVEQSTQGAWFGPRTLWLWVQSPLKIPLLSIWNVEPPPQAVD